MLNGNSQLLFSMISESEDVKTLEASLIAPKLKIENKTASIFW
jgi:hypothetical protein